MRTSTPRTRIAAAMNAAALCLSLTALLAAVAPMAAHAQGRHHSSSGSKSYTKSYTRSYRSSTPSVRVHSYTTHNGSFVESHRRTHANGTKLDNWSTKGNVNPYSGKAGTKSP